MDPCDPRAIKSLKGLIDGIPEDPCLLWVKAAPTEGWGGGPLLVYPASFNPPTKAHLWLLKGGMARSGADEAVAVLDHRPMDKELSSTTLDRLLMLLKALRGEDRTSIALANRGLFLDKLRLLRRDRPGKEVVFLVGWDTLLRLFDPRYYEDPEGALKELFSGARVLVALRGEASLRDVEDFLERKEVRPFRTRIEAFEPPPHLRSVSSTEVRRRAREGEPLLDLVPPEVEAYIRKRGLYR